MFLLELPIALSEILGLVESTQVLSVLLAPSAGLAFMAGLVLSAAGVVLWADVLLSAGVVLSAGLLLLLGLADLVLPTSFVLSAGLLQLLGLANLVLPTGFVLSAGLAQSAGVVLRIHFLALSTGLVPNKYDLSFFSGAKHAEPTEEKKSKPNHEVRNLAGVLFTGLSDIM